MTYITHPWGKVCIYAKSHHIDVHVNLSALPAHYSRTLACMHALAVASASRCRTEECQTSSGWGPGPRDKTDVSDSLSCPFVFPTARSAWSSCSPSIWARLTFQWLRIRTRSGRCSSIPSSSSSLWVATTVPNMLNFHIPMLDFKKKKKKNLCPA